MAEARPQILSARSDRDPRTREVRPHPRDPREIQARERNSKTARNERRPPMILYARFPGVGGGYTGSNEQE